MKLKTLLLAFLMFVPFSVSADYTFSQNWDFGVEGASNLGRYTGTAVGWVATSTGRISSYQFKACVATTSAQMYFVAYTGQVVTSADIPNLHPIGTSTIAVVSSLCNTRATSTVYFVPPLELVPDVTITIISYGAQNMNGQLATTILNQPPFYTFNRANNPIPSYALIGSSAKFIASASGTPPNFNYDTYDSTVQCSTFDIGCYITNAFVFLFYPTATIEAFLDSPKIASTTPFAYIYEAKVLYNYLWTGTATGTQTLNIDFAPMGMATSTLSAGTLSQMAGFAGASDFFALVRSTFVTVLWIFFVAGTLKFALKIIGVGGALSAEQTVITKIKPYIK